MAWIATVAVAAYGAYTGAADKKKQAKAAAKGKSETAYRTPYMNERIAPVMPYIMSEAQKIYESRMKQYGLAPGDFSPISAMLAGVPSNYSGVGAPGNAIMSDGSTQNFTRMIPQSTQQAWSDQMAAPGWRDEQQKMFSNRVGRGGGGGRGPGGGGMSGDSTLSGGGGATEGLAGQHVVDDMTDYWNLDY